MSTFLNSRFISLTPVRMASTWIFVSFRLCVAKAVCSMLNACCCRLPSCDSYVFFCRSTRSAFCFTMFCFPPCVNNNTNFKYVLLPSIR